MLSPGDVRGVLACIREDFDQHAYFITGDHGTEYLVLHFASGRKASMCSHTTTF